MKVQGGVSGYAFSRNPLIARDEFPLAENPNETGSFTVDYANGTTFNGRFTPPLRLNLADIIDPQVDYFQDAETIDHDTPIFQIEDVGELSCRRMELTASYDGYESGYGCIIIPGGISKQNYKRLVGRGSDVFLTRFFNFKGNFFLTTRTPSWRIVMKETELYPLYFINPETGTVADIDIVETATGETWNYTPDVGVYALDPAHLRRFFVDEFGVLASVFDIYMDSKFAVRLVIERTDPTRERYRLKFRNSLGVFEIIEVTGTLTVKPTYEEADDKKFRRYDDTADDYYTGRERLERRRTVTVNTGTKTPDETRHIMDLVSSDEVYLLDLTILPVPVIPTVSDEFTYSPRPDTPQSFALNLEIAEDETNIMQDIIDGSESQKQRVFSKQFSKQFN